MAQRDKRRRSDFEKDLAAAQEAPLSTRIMDSHETTDVPVIYHYTDSKGLIGILSDGQLWATDIRYLNDSSELQHAEKLHRQVLEEFIADGTGRSLQSSLATRALEDRYADFPGRQTYVACFCAEDDLLTQWKTYGAWGSGFSIGFDRRQLELALPNLAPPTPSPIDVLSGFGPNPEVNLQKVEYSEEEQKRYLKLAFNRYCALLSNDSSSAQIADCAAAIVGNADRSASRFKHPAFEPEKEWRIVMSSPPFASSQQLFFRSSSRTVIPYAKTTRQPNGKLPVVSVTVGPTLDKRLSGLSVVALLGATGYYNGEDRYVQIKTSNVPLTRTD